MLEPNCSGEFDSGGTITGAPLDALVGAEAIALTLVFAFAGSDATFEVDNIKGEPGIIVRANNIVMAAICIEHSNDAITHIHAVGNPNKLPRRAKNE